MPRGILFSQQCCSKGTGFYVRSNFLFRLNSGGKGLRHLIWYNSYNSQPTAARKASSKAKLPPPLTLFIIQKDDVLFMTS